MKVVLSLMDSDWLVEVSYFVVIGKIYPGWELKKGLLGTIERDQTGHYYISNEALGIYAVGFTREDAEVDFRRTLIDNYQSLEAQAEEDPDLNVLFSEYQEYLARAAGRRGGRL